MPKILEDNDANEENQANASAAERSRKTLIISPMKIINNLQKITSTKQMLPMKQTQCTETAKKTTKTMKASRRIQSDNSLGLQTSRGLAKGCGIKMSHCQRALLVGLFDSGVEGVFGNLENCLKG